MKKCLFYLFLIFCKVYFTPINCKIYDCFIFYNELEILEIRLNELYEHVDKFVLVESKETFRGNPKELYYNENKHLFKKFEDKIIHVIIDEPLHTESNVRGPYENGPNWAREHYQREQIMQGLTDCLPDDLIFISDVDEIINSSVISSIKQNLEDNQDEFKLALCLQKMYRFYLNRFVSNNWHGSVGILYKHLQKTSPQQCRNIRKDAAYIVNDGGWHFTYIGGYHKVVNKLSSFAHAEFDLPENKDVKFIEQRILSYQLVKIDETYPNYVYKNIDKLIESGLIDTFNNSSLNSLSILNN